MTVQRPPNIRPRPAGYDDDDDLGDHVSQNSGTDDSDAEVIDEITGEDEMEEQSNEGDYEEKVKNISFGALKQAQDALSRKRKHGSDTNEEQEEKMEALRARLRKIKEAKTGAGSSKGSQTSTVKHNLGSAPEPEDVIDDDDDSSDSDSGPSEEDAQGRARTSKHAPTSMSSKRQVTRKRNVVDLPKRVVRDPRFDAIAQRSGHSGDSEKAYSFLRDYQKSEIQELKTALKKAKSEEDKEVLKRNIGSMENRIRAKESKEREQEIIRKHRKEEREKVQQGKTPYYLKHKDVKEKALVEKFKGMKGKDREKLIEKRKKKEGQKEKKRMPEARRLAG